MTQKPQQFTPAAAWLGANLATNGVAFENEIEREACAAGFTMQQMREAFAAIDGDVEPSGAWCLSAERARFWRSFAIAHPIAPLGREETARDIVGAMAWLKPRLPGNSGDLTKEGRKAGFTYGDLRDAAQQLGVSEEWMRGEGVQWAIPGQASQPRPPTHSPPIAAAPPRKRSRF